MFKKSCVFLFTILCAFQAEAADQGWYTRADTGYSWTSDSVDGGAIVGAGVGYQFNDHIRADVTLGYRGWYSASESTVYLGNTISGSADVNSTDGLVNAYYDIGHFGQFTPYVGAGAGFAYNKTDAATVNLNGAPVGQIGGDSRTDFSWQVGAGTAFRFTDNLSLDVGYRYMDMGKAQTSDTFTNNAGTSFSGFRQTVDLHGSEVQAGLRWTF